MPDFKRFSGIEKVHRNSIKITVDLWSEWRDLNPRHPAPKAGALPTALHPVIEFFIRLGVFSQTRRDTNFAIPGYSFFCHDTTAERKIKDFPVCGQTCGQSRFCAAFSSWGKTSKRRCCKALWRFALTRPGYRHGTPKPGAIPASLYPDMRVSADKHFAIIAKAAGECKHFLILKKN